MLDLRFRKLWLAVGLLLLLSVLVGGLLPTVPSPNLPGGDKAEHFLGYLALSAWFTALVQRRRYVLVIVSLLALGAFIEVAQTLMALGREGDWLDMLANIAGVLVGLLVALASRESWLVRAEQWIATR